MARCAGTRWAYPARGPSLFQRILHERLALRATPNPFNPRTQLDFQLLRPSTVSLKVYDIQGRLVRELLQGVELGAGTHHAVLQASDAEGESASGVFLVQLKTEHGQVVRKVTLLR